MQWLDTFKGIGQKTWNTIRAVGPFLVSQSDKASEAFQRHLGRVAEADALRDLLKGEVETRTAIRRSLLERYITAPPEERIRIEQDIDYVDGVTRQLNIAAKSLNYGNEEPTPQPPPEEPKAIEDHWLDRFNELARKRNEDWRNELLARALAAETATPGAVSPRALWLIGNLEHSLFIALSDLLDLCVWLWPQGGPFLPHSSVQAFERKPARAGADPRITVGHLVFQLADIGVLAEHLTTSKQFPAGVTVGVRYDQTAYLITTKQMLSISGILLTPLGESIAKFFEPHWNQTGASVLADWIASLTPEQANVQQIRLPQ